MTEVMTRRTSTFMLEKGYTRVHALALGVIQYRGERTPLARSTKGRSNVLGKGWDRAQVERRSRVSRPL